MNVNQCAGFLGPLLITAGLIVSGHSPATTKSALSSTLTEPNASSRLKTVAELRAEAGQYDAATRDISKLLNIQLETENDFDQARVVAEKAAPGLKFQISRLIVMSLDNTTFINGIRAKLKDKTTAQNLVSEITSNPAAVLKLDGAQALKSQFAAKIQASSDLFVKILDRIRVAKQKQGVSSEFSANAAAADTETIAEYVMITSFNVEACTIGSSYSTILGASQCDSLGDMMKELESKMKCTMAAFYNRQKCIEQASHFFGAAKSVALLGCELGYLFQMNACQ